MMEVVLAIDGGGSRTRCLAITKDGRLVGSSVAGPSNHLQVAKDMAAQSLAQATAEVLAQAALRSSDVPLVSAGLAGVDYDGTGADEMEAVFRELGFRRSLINGDMVIAHAGALTGRPGVIALAGTGSAILGIGFNKERIKVGGWGPIYGDEGSAYRIGQRSLVAAARAYDGTGPDTSLGDALVSALGLRDFRETLSRVYVQGMEPREIAALSRVAYEVAEEGDGVARAIFIQAGEELAESVGAAIKRLSMRGTTLCSYQGAILDTCALVRESFIAHLKRHFPESSVVPPRFEPVVGAYLLGREALGWTLDSDVVCTLEAERETK